MDSHLLHCPCAHASLSSKSALCAGSPSLFSSVSRGGAINYGMGTKRIFVDKKDTIAGYFMVWL